MENILQIKIITDLIPENRKNRSKILLRKPYYITIHDTGNTSAKANAKAHANYLKTSQEVITNLKSWHYTVDDKEIYQHLPDTEVGWNAGDGYYGTGNRNSIQIEICMNKGINRQAAEDLAARLTALLMTKHNISIDKVVQHNHWSGKNCPEVLRSRPKGWETFINLVKYYYTLLAKNTAGGEISVVL